jgi:Domain of unknown function (DUF4276)
VRIAIVVEGATERAFLPVLREFLDHRLGGQMPAMRPIPQDGRIPKGEKLRRVVEHLLMGRDAYDAVLALTDVYTGTGDFVDGADARRQMCEWVDNNPRFHPHAAQHDFEAWLLPFWSTIQQLAGHNRAAPAGPPEKVNHDNPPSKRIQAIFPRASAHATTTRFGMPSAF